MTSGPYRGSTSGGWVCLVCYKQRADHAGLCPTCEVDLNSLDNPEVRSELRAEAERRLQKKMYGEYFGLSLLGFTVAIPALPLIGWIFYTLFAFGVGWGFTRAWTLLRPRSALGLYADRRRRLGAELAAAAQQKALPVHVQDPALSADETDPEDLDLEATLRWLGMERGAPKR